MNKVTLYGGPMDGMQIKDPGPMTDTVELGMFGGRPARTDEDLEAYAVYKLMMPNGWTYRRTRWI